MNYSGKFDATIPLGGLGPASHSYVHVASPASHAPADAIIVPDAQLLFSADFRRSGADLVLSKDEREFVLHDYFKGEKRAPLASPDGAHLTGDLVDALSGHVQLSQASAGAAAVGHVIGHVTKLVGSATVVRNGVSIILTMGENVEKGDVVQCGSNSSLGITFIDGTVFGLLSNARMVLNEMVYDPNGSSNSSLISLVAGTISFVAGETAKHGDMKIDTPVATMGIRGTACLVEIDFNVPAQNATPNASFQVLVEPDGTTGSYILYDKTTLQPLAVVNQAGQQLNINNGVISTSQNPLSPDIQKLIQDVFTQKFTENTQTKTTTAQTDTINPLLIGTPVRLANGTSATPIFAIKGDAGTGGTTQSLDQLLNGLFHIAGPPTLAILDTQGVETTSFSVVRQIVTSGNALGMDSTGGTVVFQDINRGDSPSVSATFASFKLLNANGQDVSTSLSASQLAGIKAAEVDLALFPNAGNSNNGQTTWVYNIHDSALSFLAPGEKLTLTYDVTVSNNYSPLLQSTTKQITITIVGGTPVQQWIHTANDGHDNLWTTAQNWASGIVPTTGSDVIIVTDQLHSLLPAYPVTIENTDAVARSVILNDLTPSSNDRPELDVESLSTLTIGTTLSLGSDSILRNRGTISVGGKMELLDQAGPPVLLNQSVIFNAGTMNLGQGGDVQGLAGITNTGIIDLKGGTLNVLVNIANSEGESSGQITVEAGATLALGTDPNGDSEATGGITGGRVTVNGVLELQGGNFLSFGTLVNNKQINVTGTGNALNGETVTNAGVIDVRAGGALTVDPTTINNASGTVAVDAGGKLTLNAVTIDGGTVTNNGEIDLAGGGVLENGSLGNLAKILVSDTGNALQNETVTANSVLEVLAGGDLMIKGSTVANTSGAVTVDESASLTVNATTVSGGAVTSKVNGTIAFTGSTSLQNGALNNSGQVNVSGTGNTWDAEIVANVSAAIAVTGALTLEHGTSVTGGTLANSGEVFVETSSGATLDNVHVDNIGGTIQVDIIEGAPSPSPATLIVDDGTTISNGTLKIGSVGVLEIASPIGATFSRLVVYNSNLIQVDPGSVLSLENVTINGGRLGGPGTIETTDGNTDSTLNGVTLNAGARVTAAAGELDLTGTITNNGELDASGGGKLDLENVTINGGTLGGNGTIATVSGLNTLNGITIASATTVKVTDNTVLELEGTIANLGTIALISSGHSTKLEISGSVLLGGGGQVTLSDDNNAIVSDGSPATFCNFDTITGAGTIGDSCLTLVNSGTIDATGSHALRIDTGNHVVTNNAGGVLEASAGHELQIDGDVLNNGLIEAGNAGDNSAAVVTVTGSITGTGSIEIFSNAKLEIGCSVSFEQTVTFGMPGGPVATAAMLILDDSHHFYGTIFGLTENSNESLENVVDLKDLAYRADCMSAHYSDGVVTVSNGKDCVTLNVSGNASNSFELASDGTGGTLLDDPPASGTVTIDSGKTLDISDASAATVTFANSAGSTGELLLDNSKAFTGQIVGFAGDGTTSNSNLIDLTDVNFADVATSKTTYTDHGDGTGTLTLYNANGQELDSLSFVGQYQLANFTLEDDGAGHTLIVDPPVVNNLAGGQSVGASVANDPAHPSSTIVATAQNQTLTGSAPSDNFVFNFAEVGHATVTDFHPELDTLQFKTAVFASAQAALNATHDDGHGNAIITVDAHDTITLNGVLKAQLHANDFHVV